MSATLWIGLALSLATAVVYASVGRRLLMRADEGPKPPLRAFALWWFALAVYTSVLAARDALAITGLLDRDLLKMAMHLSVGPLVLALWGLFYYLAYILVGGKRLFWPSVALYGIVYAFFVYVAVALEPGGVTLRTWDVTIDYATEIPPAVNALVLVLLIVPILLAVIAYASLLFRLESREQRFRVGVVSLAFAVWFGGALLAALLGLADVEWWGLGGRLLSIASAGLVAFAYRPGPRPRARPREPFPAEVDGHG